MNAMKTPDLEILNAIPSLWNMGMQIRSDWINRNSFIYIIDFEVRLNLDIIAALKFDKPKENKNPDKNTKSKESAISSVAFENLVNSFETNAIRALIAGNDRKNCKKFIKIMKKHWKEEEFENEDETTPSINEREKIQSVINSLIFVVRKIEVLKSISRIAKESKEETDLLKEINLERRFKNLKEALLKVRNCLEEVIKSIEECQCIVCKICRLLKRLFCFC